MIYGQFAIVSIHLFILWFLFVLKKTIFNYIYMLICSLFLLFENLAFKVIITLLNKSILKNKKLKEVKISFLYASSFCIVNTIKNFQTGCSIAKYLSLNIVFDEIITFF